MKARELTTLGVTTGFNSEYSGQSSSVGYVTLDLRLFPIFVSRPSSVSPSEPAGPPTVTRGATTSNALSHLTRSAGVVSLATLLSRVLGLVRDLALAFHFGANNAMDAFSVAFRIPNLTRDLFDEGAMSSAFVPTLTRRLTYIHVWGFMWPEVVKNTCNRRISMSTCGLKNRMEKLILEKI